MDKETILSLAKKVNCEYEIGIWSETNDFLERQEDILSYKLGYEEKKFILKIKLREFNLIEIKILFHSLITFLEYSSAIYCREEKDGLVEYYFLSSLPDKKAFLLNIIFYS